MTECPTCGHTTEHREVARRPPCPGCSWCRMGPRAEAAFRRWFWNEVLAGLACPLPEPKP